MASYLSFCWSHLLMLPHLASHFVFIWWTIALTQSYRFLVWSVHRYGNSTLIKYFCDVKDCLWISERNCDEVCFWLPACHWLAVQQVAEKRNKIIWWATRRLAHKWRNTHLCSWVSTTGTIFNWTTETSQVESHNRLKRKIQINTITQHATILLLKLLTYT